MKLYLGCALPPFHPQHLEILGNTSEWVLVDLYVNHPDIQNWDATKLEQVADGSCEKIYASHLLEHIEHGKLQETIQLWHRKLIDGGELLINVPDLEWLAQRVIQYERGEKLDGYYNRFDGEHGLLSIVYGSQSHEGEHHKSGFTQRYLVSLLSGFSTTDIKRTFDAHDMGVLIAKVVK